MKSAPEFEIGDIVLLKDEIRPPCNWVLAQILDKNPGKDNKVRANTLRYNGKS